MGFPGRSDGKQSACNAGNLGSIPGLGRSPGGGHGNPLQYSCLENPHGQRSLAGYGPWGGKELVIAERLRTDPCWLSILNIAECMCLSLKLQSVLIQKSSSMLL